MKLLSLITICFVLFLGSCKKENGTGFTSYLKGKVDGVSFECTANIKANKPEQIPPGPEDPTIRLTGEWASNSIQLMLVTETSNITTGTYPLQADKKRSATIYLGANGYYAGNSGPFLPPQLHVSGSITITEVSKNYVKGTFQFTTEANMGIIKTVTDGEFYIKRE